MLQNKELEDSSSEIIIQPEASISKINLKNKNSSILEISPQIIAAHISIIDIGLFQKINDDELLSISWTKQNKEIITPNICKITNQFNNISCLTISEILDGKSPRERALIITHFIKILNELFSLNNLNSMKSILTALECYSIYRLKNSFEFINKKHRTNLNNHKMLLSEDNNREKLRAHLDKSDLPCVPFLGLYLTDLTYLDTVHSYSKDESEEERKNKMYEVIKHIKRFQKSNYNFKTDPDLIDFFSKQRYTDLMKKTIDETFYRRSLIIEPPLSPLVKVDHGLKKNHRSKTIKSDLTNYLRTYIPIYLQQDLENPTGKKLSLNIQQKNTDSSIFIDKYISTQVNSPTKKKPKYIHKIENISNIVHEGYLKLKIQSFTGTIPHTPQSKKIWAILTKDMRLTHYLMNIMKFSCVFGNGQNSIFYVIDNIKNFTLKPGKTEFEFIIISQSMDYIHTYTALTEFEAKEWLLKLEETAEDSRKVSLNNSIDFQKN